MILEYQLRAHKLTYEDFVAAIEREGYHRFDLMFVVLSKMMRVTVGALFQDNFWMSNPDVNPRECSIILIMGASGQVYGTSEYPIFITLDFFGPLRGGAVQCLQAALQKFSHGGNCNHNPCDAKCDV